MKLCERPIENGVRVVNGVTDIFDCDNCVKKEACGLFALVDRENRAILAALTS